jgi:hypothetical protein
MTEILESWWFLVLTPIGFLLAYGEALLKMRFEDRVCYPKQKTVSVTPGTIFVRGQQVCLRDEDLVVRIKTGGTVAYCTRTGETIFVERGEPLPAGTVPICEVEP